MYRLIIADDEENIRNGMANSLPWREWGYEVAAVCASGQEVLDRMEDCRPDVVLSDIRMPGMDGVELMQRLSREYPQVKIVILSGYSDFKYLNMSIRSHVAEYLLKPTDIDDFEETFRRLKAAMDHERLRRAQITESVLRHFHVWLTAMLGGVATPEDTDRFMPMLTEAGIDLDNLQVAAFVLDGHGGDERPDQVALWRRVWEVTAALPAGPLRRLSFLLGGEDMVVLYSSGEEIAPGDVRADIEAIQRAVRDGLRVTLSAGVSDLCTEPGMLPQAYEQANCSAKQSAFAGQEAVYFFSQMQKERPAGMPYFDTEQVEKALLAQDYDALRAEIDRVLLPLAERLPEYRAVDQLCLSLLFHVSLWGLRYGIQMEEVLRALGAHYTDVYQSETLAAKRDFVLACLFGCQQALAARRRSHSHAVKSVAMRVREYVDAEYCSNALSLESVAAYVHKTPAYISRVFKNELGCNFSDYLTEKRMRVAAWRRGEKLLLTVTDNGVGMDRAALARLRDQIVHGRKPRAEANYRSTGIGLHNIGARLRLYAGSSSCIRVQSKPQFGTRVTLELPWRAIGTES